MSYNITRKNEKYVGKISIRQNNNIIDTHVLHEHDVESIHLPTMRIKNSSSEPQRPIK